MKLRFPERLWLSGQIKPSEVILDSLQRRRFLALRRNGMSYAQAKYESEADDAAIRLQYGLPNESIRYTLSRAAWDCYVKLNSFRKTRGAANDFLNKNKTISDFQANID